MKREKNVENAVLISAEAQEYSKFTVHELKEKMDASLWYDTIEGHVRLLVDDGLLEPVGVDNSLGQNRELFRLTSNGYKCLKRIK